MVTRLLGRKLGMSQIYDETGRCVPVTILEAGPCVVTQVKTKKKDGYNAVQLGFGTRKNKNMTRPELGHTLPRPKGQDEKARKKQIDQESKKRTAPEFIREIPWDGKEEINVGDTIDLSIFEEFPRVDVVGFSKGRGFMGAIRRWGFHRQAKNKQSGHERAPGSLIGGVNGGFAGKVVPGKKMPGHWGDEKVTHKNLVVERIDKDRNLIFLRGGVPGAVGAQVIVRESNWVAPKVSQVKAARKK